MTYKEALKAAAVELGQKEERIAGAIRYADELAPNTGSQMNEPIPAGHERPVIERFKEKLSRTPEEILKALAEHLPEHQKKIAHN